MSGPAHFKGKANILDAYELNQVGPWAIFSGRDILFQCTDPDTNVAGAVLENVLDKLIEGGGGGQFQLKIYEDLPEGKKITNTTPFNYSFKFLLMTDDEFERTTGRTLGGSGAIGAVLDRLTAIETRLQERERDQEEEPEPQSKFMGAIGAMLERPDVQNYLMGKVIGLADGLFSFLNPRPRPSMAGVQTEQPMDEGQETAADLFNRLPADERAKFDQACYVLLKGDPAIGTNLMKLANILQTDPAKYKMLTKMA